MGLYSSALLECEGILQLQPNSPDIVALMGEIESRTAPVLLRAQRPRLRLRPHQRRVRAIGLAHRALARPQQAARRQERRQRQGGRHSLRIRRADDGNEHFAKFLTFHRIVPETDVDPRARRASSRSTASSTARALATSLLDELTRTGAYDIDDLLSSLIDATKFGYVPLEYYDIDRAIVRMLPDSLTLGRLIVPFDIVSRTMMIALCNPFDAAAKQAVQSSHGLPHPVVSGQARRHLARAARRVPPRSAAINVSCPPLPVQNSPSLFP